MNPATKAALGREIPTSVGVAGEVSLVDSFEDVGLSAELVEALSAEGVERPTPLQQALIPLIRKGNNALVRAGPGSGTLVGYGAGLLDRLEGGGQAPRAVVLVASPEAARSLAESLARLAVTTGHQVAALGSAWALPEQSDILFSTPPDLLESVRGSRIQLESLEAMIVDGAALVQRVWGLDGLETLGRVPFARGPARGGVAADHGRSRGVRTGSCEEGRTCAAGGAVPLVWRRSGPRCSAIPDLSGGQGPRNRPRGQLHPGRRRRPRDGLLPLGRPRCGRGRFPDPPRLHGRSPRRLLASCLVGRGREGGPLAPAGFARRREGGHAQASIPRRTSTRWTSGTDGEAPPPCS